MSKKQTTRHFQSLTHRRPAQADLSWLDMLLGVFDPAAKSVRVEK